MLRTLNYSTWRTKTVRALCTPTENPGNPKNPHGQSKPRAPESSILGGVVDLAACGALVSRLLRRTIIPKHPVRQTDILI